MNDTTTTISKTVFFNASRATVWSFLTDKDKLAQWFHPAEADLTEGEDYALVRKTDDGLSVRQIWGRVLKMEAPSKLVYTFVIDPFNGAETTVTWVLEEAAGGTRLSLTHEGVAEATGNAAMQLLMALDHGWDEHLDRLRKSATPSNDPI
jgi:uncharacterized protein YndB with AHSA1/START domain